MKILYRVKENYKPKKYTVICNHCQSMLEGYENEFRVLGYQDRYLYTCPVCNMQRLATKDELVEVIETDLKTDIKKSLSKAAKAFKGGRYVQKKQSRDLRPNN